MKKTFKELKKGDRIWFVHYKNTYNIPERSEVEILKDVIPSQFSDYTTVYYNYGGSSYCVSVSPISDSIQITPCQYLTIEEGRAIKIQKEWAKIIINPCLTKLEELNKRLERLNTRLEKLFTILEEK